MQSGLIDLTLPSTRIKKHPNLITSTRTLFVETRNEILPTISASCSFAVSNDLSLNYTPVPPVTLPLVEGQLYQIDIGNNNSCSFNLQYASQIKNSYVTISLADTYSIETIEFCTLTPHTIYRVKYQYV